jgi:hypothetical protein
LTSEVLLMNLEAVVMGADSAVTISSRDRASFSQSGIEKIFLIHDKGPVAAMIYGGGSYCGLPWRTVLREFTEFCGPDLLPIDTYFSKLTEYLSNIEQHADVGIESSYEIDNFNIYVDDFVHDYLLWLLTTGWTPGLPISEAAALKALHFMEEEVLFEPASPFGGEAVDPGPVPRARAEASNRLTDLVSQHIGTALSTALGRKLHGVAMPDAAIPPLMRLAVESLLVEWLPDSSMYTGLVLSGFGAGQALPALYSFRFVGAFGGLLKTRRFAPRRPRPNVDPVIFHSYAQDELIRGFIYGALPEYEQTLRHVTMDYLVRTFEGVIQKVGETNKKLAEQLSEQLADVAHTATALGLNTARELRSSEVFETLWPALDSANADVLASHALKLMELTVLEHELLAEPSVGRPIWVLAMERGRHYWLKDGARQ